MVVLKALSLVLAALFSLLAMKLVMREMQAVRVKAHDRRRPQRRIRLRQDPRTGIYYPEA